MVSKDSKPRSFKSKDPPSGLSLKSKRTTSLSSASANANRSDDGTNVTLNTLSMISSPWTTESGFTPLEYSSQSLLSWTTDTYTSSSSSLEPMTTTASSDLQSFISKATITLMQAATPCQSVRMCPPKKSSSSHSVSSWTIETYTSEGLMFSDNSHSHNVRVKHPLSPVSSGTDYYPSSKDTLSSRKGSRNSISLVSVINEEYFPINYINHVTLNPESETHLGLDWKFAKENGIPIVISVPIY